MAEPGARADQASTAQILAVDGVRLGASATDKWDAITQVGNVLVEIGAVDPEYVAAMAEREQSISTYMGEGVAIPHGTDASRAHVRRAALAVVQFPGGVDWNGQQAQLVIGIASSSDEHVGLLAALAGVLTDKDSAEKLRAATDPAVIVALLRATDDTDDTDDEDED